MTQQALTIPAGETRRAVVVGALGCIQILSWGSTFYLLPVLATPIVRDTGWAYDRVMGGLALGLLIAGTVSPRVGRTIGHYGGRWVLAGGSLLVALGLGIIGFAESFALYLAGWAVLGAGMAAALYDATFATLGALYGTGARSSITAVTLYGGFASTVCWPLSAMLVDRFGWRGACFAYAGIHIFIGMTLALTVIPARRPEPQTLSAAVIAPSALQANERSMFVVLAVVLTISAAILSLMGSQLITLLLASNLTLAQAVGLGMIIGPAAVGARFVEMLAGSRYHPIWTMVASASLVLCGAVLFLMGSSIFAAAIAMYAAGNGIGSIAKGTLPLALFGADRYPRLLGRLALPILFAMSLAPYGGALSFQLAGVKGTFGLLLVLAATNVLLVAFLSFLTRSQRALTPT